MTANYDLPSVVEKRVRFFDGQFLQDQDFVDEQKYHLDRERRHLRLLHVAGIADGLAVTAASAPNKVTVAPGTAIDSDGRQLALAQAATVDLPAGTSNLYISYRESAEDEQTEVGGRGFTRWLERPQLMAIAPREAYAGATPPVLLARVAVDNAGRVTVDDTVRSYSGLRLPGPAADAPTLRSTASGRVGLTGSLTVDGNVGIGTTSSGPRLDIAGAADTAGQASLQLRSGNTAANFDSDQITLGYNNTAQYRHAIKTRHHGGQKAGNAIDFYVWNYSTQFGAADRIGGLHTMTLDGGNVGIGTTSPGAKLQVSGGAAQFDGDQQILFTDQDMSNNLKLQLWSGYGLGINPGMLFYAANGRHSWRDNSGANERMALTTAADGGLTVTGTGTSSFAGGVSIAGGASVAGNASFVGNVGIGTTSPGAKLEVAGDLKFTGNNLATGALGRITPFLVRGTGSNNTAARMLVLGSTTVYNAGEGRGLTLTILRKSDHGVVSTASYDTYGSADPANSLAAKLNDITKDQLGILASYDSWDLNVSADLRAAFRRLGLYRAAMTSGGSRRPYAAVFDGSKGEGGTARAVEVLHAATGTVPFADIRGWLVDGSFVATGGAPNGLTNNLGTEPVVLVGESGNVGVGTTEPSARLSVVQPGATQLAGTAHSGVLRTSAGALGTAKGSEVALSSTGLTVGNHMSLGVRAIRTAAGSDWYNTAIGLGMDVDNTVRAGAALFLHANGNIGIGTTTPPARLSVVQPGATELAGTAHSGVLRTSAGALGTAKGSEVALSSTGLTVPASISFGVRALRTKEGQDYWTTAIGLGMDVDNTVRAGAALFLHGTGNVGIGTTTPEYRLDVSGSCRVTGTLYYTSQEALSDARLKKRIQRLDSTLDKLAEIRGVSYLRRHVGGPAGQREERPAIGVLAQEVEPVFPELVSTIGEHDYKGVDYNGLTAVLLEAVKELKATLDPLQERVAALEAHA